MASARLSMVEMLQNEFKAADVRLRLQRSSKEWLEKDPARTFDKFPLMISPQKLQQFTSTFLAIFTNIQITTDVGVLLSTKKNWLDIIFEKLAELLNLKMSARKFFVVDGSDFKKWFGDVVLYACEEMLDGHGNIRGDLMSLLGWEDLPYFKSLDFVQQTVIAGVFAMIEQIFYAMKTELGQSPEKYFAVSHFLNRSVGEEWIKKVIVSTQKKDLQVLWQWILSTPDAGDTSKLSKITQDLANNMRAEKNIDYWLSLIFLCGINKKPELFFPLWQCFKSSIKPERLGKFLTAYQCYQFQFCNKLAMRVHMERKNSSRVVREKLLNANEDKSPVPSPRAVPVETPAAVAVVVVSESKEEIVPFNPDVIESKAESSPKNSDVIESESAKKAANDSDDDYEHLSLSDDDEYEIVPRI